MNDRTNNPPQQEDLRVTAARKAVTESAAAEPGSRGYSGAHWHGRLHIVVEQLLAYVDERKAER